MDLDEDNFRYHGIIPFSKIDLNDQALWREFIDNNMERYDVVISMETIEHLENPWSFVRGLKDLVKRGGHIIITTPNIESPWSKLCFFLRDRFHMFMEGDLAYGHINPLTGFELSLIFKKIGLDEMAIHPGGEYPLVWVRKSALDSILWLMANVFSLPFSRKINYSWCKIYLLKKPNPSIGSIDVTTLALEGP